MGSPPKQGELEGVSFYANRMAEVDAVASASICITYSGRVAAS